MPTSEVTVSTHRLLAAIGSAAYLPCDIVIEVGDQHPTGHGPMQLALDVQDDTIVQAEARIGLMHRSAEKLFEVRDYRQVLMLGNRHDWINPITSELSLAVTIEQALGLTPPERATWSRTLLAELTRIGAAMIFAGASLASEAALRLRASYLDLLDAVAGARVHPHIVRIGGLAVALDPDWLHAAEGWIDDVARLLPDLMSAGQQRWEPLAGIAALSPEQAVSIGVTGPVLRASGVDLDLRRAEPYLAYADLTHLLTANDMSSQARAGDIPARHGALLSDAADAVLLVRACIDRLRGLGDGPFDVRLPKVVRVPEGTYVGQVEGPLGIAGVLLDSLGDKVPSRVKLRTPAFASVQAMAASLTGVRMEHLADAVRSFHIVVGDADR